MMVFICSEAKSYADGIWCFWKNLETRVEVLIVNDKMITVAIMRGDSVEWILSCICASSILKYRMKLWHYVK